MSTSFDELTALSSAWLEANRVWLSWLAGTSLLFLLLGMALVPVVVIRMQPDYFMPDRDVQKSLRIRHPALRVTGLILKNFLGVILFISGVLMIFLPGQGLLTILIGLALVDFPGKNKMELWLLRKKPVSWAINTLRKKADKPPLELPEEV